MGFQLEDGVDHRKLARLGQNLVAPGAQTLQSARFPRGVQMWLDDDQAALRRRCADALFIGEVNQASALHWTGVRWYAMVHLVPTAEVNAAQGRHRQRRSTIALWVLGAFWAAAFIATAVLTVYLLRWYLAAVAGALALVVIALTRANHGGACVGIHCAGCRR